MAPSKLAVARKYCGQKDRPGIFPNLLRSIGQKGKEQRPSYSGAALHFSIVAVGGVGP